MGAERFEFGAAPDHGHPGRERSSRSSSAGASVSSAGRWAQRPKAEVTGFDPLLYSFAGINRAQLAFGVLGVLIMASEYATGSIKLTFGAAPNARFAAANHLLIDLAYDGRRRLIEPVLTTPHQRRPLRPARRTCRQ
ncbi:MAG: hypothetical protein M3N95_10985 [Actinomycetota bacterium]|nr:hypothetical protein [Actinomycetota bacterium]